ncbi:hypothetical protein [endosymbiont of Lamellibrachia barhami]|uniref:hypothetical protein n=1 Tax=endosymbiont of Lamellibrachia barhami TaxID=205975 RepID=UPI0015AD8B89|nr:hypothetical protein [endosymbiont of Lamellibrachia barhami]
MGMQAMRLPRQCGDLVLVINMPVRQTVVSNLCQQIAPVWITMLRRRSHHVDTSSWSFKKVKPAHEHNDCKPFDPKRLQKAVNTMLAKSGWHRRGPQLMSPLFRDAG